MQGQFIFLLNFHHFIVYGVIIYEKDIVAEIFPISTGQMISHTFYKQNVMLSGNLLIIIKIKIINC